MIHSAADAALTFLRADPARDIGPPRRVADRAPAGPVERRRMSVRAALEWAFGTELARLDFTAAGTLGLDVRPGIGAEHRIAQAGNLQASIDTSPGRSLPSDDAQIIAALVQRVLDPALAIEVAEHARTGTAPDAMVGEAPRCVALNWRRCKHGMRAAIRYGEVITYTWRGRTIRRVSHYCPVTYEPTKAQIEAARERYTRWRRAHVTLWSVLRCARLTTIEVTTDMPCASPWKKGD